MCVCECVGALARAYVCVCDAYAGVSAKCFQLFPRPDGRIRTITSSIIPGHFTAVIFFTLIVRLLLILLCIFVNKYHTLKYIGEPICHGRTNWRYECIEQKVTVSGDSEMKQIVFFSISRGHRWRKTVNLELRVFRSKGFNWIRNINNILKLNGRGWHLLCIEFQWCSLASHL